MTTVLQEDILRHKQSGSWRSLENLALQMIADAQHHAGAQFSPQLGGGTRLMLALEHRISDDIDLFIRDPQWIAYLTPRLNDRFEAGLHGYDENAVSLRMPLKHRTNLKFLPLRSGVRRNWLVLLR